MITYEDFIKLDLRVAEILKAEKVDKSEKLLKLDVTLGEEQRQIIAGIGQSYDPQNLIGQQIIIIANLEPRSLMGLESQGMLLAADSSTGPIIITPNTKVAPGAKIK